MPDYSALTPTSGVMDSGAGTAAGVGGSLLGGAAGGPMGMLMALLGSFGPALLSKLFGGNEREKLLQQIRDLSSAGNVSKLTNQYFQQALGSPAYSGAQGSIATGANQTANDVSQRLGSMGIGTTGTGAILSSLTPSLVGSQQSRLRTEAYNQSGTQAQNEIQRRIASLTGTYGQPSMTQGLLGAGLNSFGPLLQTFLKSRYPDMFGGLTSGNQVQAPAGTNVGGG